MLFAFLAITLLLLLSPDASLAEEVKLFTGHEDDNPEEEYQTPVQDEEQEEEPTEEPEEPEEQPSSPEPSGDQPQPLIYDVDLDGQIEIDAFGDSITRGVGDFNAANTEVEGVFTPSVEAGYPLRIEQLLGVPVSNLGDPGQRLTKRGLVDFARLIPSRRPDLVIFSGGTNDAVDQINQNDFMRSAQTMINIAKAVGTVPVIATPPPACCGRAGLNIYLNEYSNILKSLAATNEVALADINKGYKNTCQVGNCYLLNRPEAVHPNTEGYDVSGEVVIATLLGIDIFAPEGPALLEQALNLEPGSIKTVPDPAPEEN